MSIETVAILGIGIQLITLAAAAVWVIGKVSTVTSLNQQAFDHLADTLSTLVISVEKLSSAITRLDNRLTILETQRDSATTIASLARETLNQKEI